MSTFLNDQFTVNSEFVNYSEENIKSTYTYTTNLVEGNKVTPTQNVYEFNTQRKVPKLGLMLVGNLDSLPIFVVLAFVHLIALHITLHSFRILTSPVFFVRMGW